MSRGSFLTEKAVRNYVVSTVKGTFQTYQHWLAQGYSQMHAIDNAMKYAAGQLRSGVSVDNIQQSLDDIETISIIAQTIAIILRRDLESIRSGKLVNS